MIATRMRAGLSALGRRKSFKAAEKSAPLRLHSCPIPVVPVKLFQRDKRAIVHIGPRPTCN